MLSSPLHPPECATLMNQNRLHLGRGLVLMRQWECSLGDSPWSLRLHRESMKNQVGYLLPLASCRLPLNHNPFHYVAPTSMLATHQSRLHHDTQRNHRHGVGLPWGIRQVCRAFKKGDNSGSQGCRIRPGSSYSNTKGQGHAVCFIFFVNVQRRSTFL